MRLASGFWVEMLKAKRSCSFHGRTLMYVLLKVEILFQQTTFILSKNGMFLISKLINIVLNLFPSEASTYLRHLTNHQINSLKIKQFRWRFELLALTGAQEVLFSVRSSVRFKLVCSFKSSSFWLRFSNYALSSLSTLSQNPESYSRSLKYWILLELCHQSWDIGLTLLMNVAPEIAEWPRVPAIDPELLQIGIKLRRGMDWQNLSWTPSEKRWAPSLSYSSFHACDSDRLMVVPVSFYSSMISPRPCPRVSGPHCGCLTRLRAIREGHPIEEV